MRGRKGRRREANKMGEIRERSQRDEEGTKTRYETMRRKRSANGANGTIVSLEMEEAIEKREVRGNRSREAVALLVRKDALGHIKTRRCVLGITQAS